MTWNPYMIFCLMCDEKTSHRQANTNKASLLFACNTCNTIFGNIPTIHQLTLEGYIKEKQDIQIRAQLEKQLDNKVEDLFQERMKRTQMSYGIIPDDRTLWQKITQLFQKI